MQRQLSPNDLPICRHATKIVQMIEQNAVVVISGKTGCGKSTQVPKFILSHNKDAKIIVCQPRRVAAQSLALRVSQQLNCKVGSTVGYHIGMESFHGQNCSILYVTYGILIQQLLFSKEIPYTHIVLDEIHQRSLEMDFTFVTLKTVLNNSNKNRVKLIIMSATLDSQHFSQYFASNESNQFFIPQITKNLKPEASSRRGNRNRFEQQSMDQNYKITTKGEEFQNAASFSIPQQKIFKTQEVYLDDLKKQDFYQSNFDQIRLPDEAVSLCWQILQKRQLDKSKGDVLIFLPGLYEIRTVKQKLMSNNINPQRIIQVHSLFSQQLYYKLFGLKLDNKIILATNIGQSSITLPFCKIVIDFCLTRKNYSKNRGVTRLYTTLASQASLIQRSGRVGRVSDGIVYRFTTKNLYQQLSRFDKPQVQCVSLQMVILRAKQLDFINENSFFSDPYTFLMSIVDPPMFADIKNALNMLVQEQALVSQSCSTELNEAHNLNLTQVGQFMVSMPCDLQVSKMILIGLKLRIPKLIISIASILMCSKPFFVHQQRRQNIENYLHSLIGYDRQNNNDYLLRAQMFRHWRQIFYQPVKKKKLFSKKPTYVAKDQVQNDQNKKEDQKQPKRNIKYQLSQAQKQQIFNFLQDFNQIQWSNQQRKWCTERGLSPLTMRQIIKIEQNIRSKIKNLNQDLSKTKTYNQLVLVCLQYAFPQNQCEVISTRKPSNQNPYFVQLPQAYQTHSDHIDDYCHPQKEYRIQISSDKKYKRIYGSNSVLKKFYFPGYFQKAVTKNTSLLFQRLIKKKPINVFSYQLTCRKNNVNIMNDSINKVMIRSQKQTKWKLLTHKFMEFSGRKMIGTSALLSEGLLHLIQLITKKYVQVNIHPSGSFFMMFKIQENIYPFGCRVGMKEISAIRDLRKLVRRGKNNKINSKDEIMTQQNIDLLIKLLIDCQNQPLKMEPWQHMFLQENKKQFSEKFYPIETAPLIEQNIQYFEAYKRWKSKKFYSFSMAYKKFTTQMIVIVCKECLTKQFVEIQLMMRFTDDELKLNQYSGSWQIQKGTKNLCCKNGHIIGQVLNEDAAKIHRQLLKIYIPFGNFVDFWEAGKQPSTEIFEEIQNKAKRQAQRQKQQIDQFQCMFCFNFCQQTGDYNKLAFDKKVLKNNFWKKIMEHMRSISHMQNVKKFTKNL